VTWFWRGRYGGGPATSIDEIAVASGVSKHTIYRWWPSKGAVLLEAMVEQARRHAGTTPSGVLAADLETFLIVTSMPPSAPRRCCAARWPGRSVIPRPRRGCASSPRRGARNSSERRMDG
jgi:AcrR family transcriptional regulator